MTTLALKVYFYASFKFFACRLRHGRVISLVDSDIFLLAPSLRFGYYVISTVI